MSTHGRNEKLLWNDQKSSGLKDFLSSIDQVQSVAQAEALEDQISAVIQQLAESNQEKLNDLEEVFETILKLLHHKKQQLRYIETQEKIHQITVSAKDITKEITQVFETDPQLLDSLDDPARAILLGEGAEATVKAVFSKKIGTTIALKQNRADDIGGSTRLERLEKEFEVSRRLQHPNIIRTYDFTKRDGVGTIAIELLEGKSLDLALFEGWENFSKDDITNILQQYANAVLYLYDNNVINQDLSVQNVIYNNGHITLFDFGLATNIDTKSTFGRRKKLDQTKKIAEVFAQILCGGRNFIRKGPPLNNMLSNRNFGLLAGKFKESQIRAIDSLLSNSLGTHSATMQPEDFMKQFISALSE